MPATDDPRAAPYSDDAALLGGELACLDALLRLHVAKIRRTYVDDAAYRGVVVRDEEVDALLDRGVASPPWARVAVDDHLQALAEALEAALHAHEARLARTLDEGVPLRLLILSVVCDLSPVERATVALALAPELDLRYERVFGWLHDDLRRQRPSVGLVLDLFAEGLGERLLGARALFGAAAPLRRCGVLRLADDPAAPGLDLRRVLTLRPAARAWLRGEAPVDPRLDGLVARLTVDPAAPPPIWDAALERRFVELANGDPARRRILRITGPAGVGRRTFAARLAATRGAPLYWVDGAAAAALDDDAFDDLLSALRLALRVELACVGWTPIDALTPRRQAQLLALLAELPAPFAFITGERGWQPSRAPPGLPPIEPLALPLPDADARASILARALPEADPAVRQAAAEAFRFPPGRLIDAAISARGLARERGAAAPTEGELLRACRDHATPKLGALAAMVSTPYDWDDLILPSERKAALHELVRRVRHGDTVLERWGFGVKHSAARGVTALFSGPPGTGKTMAAAVVARAAGRDLYRIDLSQIVSKYIGETEKHLERVFAEAESADVALFFDEADALFGKRTEIKDAHDRHANIEVSYLLQRIESYPGIVVLATNFRKNLDEAFMRRLQIVVDFALPDVTEREAIWRGVWPAAAPVDPSVDAADLAARFEISGGHIRNIAVAAAYAAAEAGASIGLAQILAAAQIEYRKIGKLVSADRFVVREPATPRPAAEAPADAPQGSRRRRR